MILTVCLNAALDLTYDVARLEPGASHKVDAVHERPGGKGLNVARVLAQLGADVVATGFAGGGSGADLRAALALTPVTDALFPIAGETRRCVTVVDPAGATVLNEPGPEVSASEWQAFVTAYDALVAEARVVVLSGSTPPGVPEDGYARLTSVARGHGALVVLDATGVQLAKAMGERPDVVKPNLDEAGGGDPLVAAADLRALGAGAAVVSCGAAGLVAATDGGTYTARGPRLDGNPTGAGDALAAALALGLEAGAGWPDLLADAVATSAAAVARPTAGEIDLGVRDRVRLDVEVHTA